MKTVLTSIITSIITVVIALFVVHHFCDDDKCATGHDGDHNKECCEHVKKDYDKHKGHGMCMEKFEDLREEFDGQLTEEEKATIEGVREKFDDAHCEEMCPEGKKKFMEEHKDDFKALLAIADNHKDFFDGLYAKMHEDHEKAGVEKHDACPEAQKCKEATEKCKGEAKGVEKKVKKKADPEKTEEAQAEAKKCKEAKEECEAECFNTFKIHFLLLDTECEGDDDDEKHDEDHD